MFYLPQQLICLVRKWPTVENYQSATVGFNAVTFDPHLFNVWKMFMSQFHYILQENVNRYDSISNGYHC